MSALEILLRHGERVHRAGARVDGVVVVVVVVGAKSPPRALSHAGVSLSCEGWVQLQLSSKGVGLVEALYSSAKPVALLNHTCALAGKGTFTGTTEIPFEVALEPMPGEVLHETYHGVFVNIQYTLRACVERGILARNLSKTLEFIVQNPLRAGPVPQPHRHDFCITPESLDNVRGRARAAVPRFRISGFIENTNCDLDRPLTGEVVVEESALPVTSIEVQLVRVETVGSADGYQKERTEIQNLQIADGDVLRGEPVPIFVIFPRLFTCPTVAAPTFKIEFEINLIVAFTDGRVVTENFPITLLRGDTALSIGSY